MKNDKVKKALRITVDVIAYVFAGLLLFSAVICIILRASGNSIKVFGYRFDVVLTDSMSEKNPDHEDFLKGHDDQIQPMDMVVTNTRVTQDDIEVYDIVLFNNPSLNVTDMHRIVDKTLKDQDNIYITNAYYQTLNGVNGFSFRGLSGGIVSNVICATQMTLVTYSTELDERDHFKFSYTGGFYDVDVTREAKDGGYYTTYHLDTGSTSPRRLAVAHACEYDYSAEVISSCVINSTLGDIDIKEDNLKAEDNGYHGIYNTSYYFEIRGDKSSTSDGKQFTMEHIIGKVVNRIPKIGYVISYLSSVWGMILLIGLGVIIINFEIVSKILAKREQAAAAKANNEEAPKENPEVKKEEKEEKNE